MSVVAPADSTVAYIRKKVRRLTSSSSESSLTTPNLDQYINNFYNNDFPYGIKIDQMRDVYTFYTEPYRDTYDVDVNYIQGVRAPFYVDGIEGSFLKDRKQFYNVWPKFPTYFQPCVGDGVLTAYSGTFPGPFLPNTFNMGVISDTGDPISISDDGLGILYYRSPNPRVLVPNPNVNPAPAGMVNANTLNPGLTNSIQIGTVNYVTGVWAFDLDLANVIPGNGEVFSASMSQYSPGRPYCLLFWNNTFTIRPVPKKIHRLDIEVYLTPVQFMLSTNNPILNQWAKYLAYGAAIDILMDRKDTEAVKALLPMFKEQEGLVLDRQATEEIGVPNYTLFNSTARNYINGGWGQGGGWY